MFIVDAHLDLSMNALEWNRDLRLPVHAIREREKEMRDKPDRGNGTVSLHALREGNIGLVVATQIARFVEPGSQLPGWNSPYQAWAQTQGQLAWYRAMEEAGEMTQIRDPDSLERHLQLWQPDPQSPASAQNTTLSTQNNKFPVGYILSLEGADSLVTVKHVEQAYSYGLRALGPAHYGPGRYANGTDATGKMGKPGLDLLAKMEELNIILDATHLCDDAFWQAMDHFHGPVWASHNNCRKLVDHNRQFSDEMIRELINRGAVIGAALDAWMMVPGWIRQQSWPKPMNCNLEVIIDHIDHICQIAGNSLHVGMGSDLDGAFGKEQSPYDLDTIADLQKVPRLLQKRGYKPEDITNMMHGNWIRFLRNTWK